REPREPEVYAKEWFYRTYTAVEFDGLSPQQKARVMVLDVPMYVGIGLRVVANVRNAEASAAVSGLGGLSAAVESKAASGDLLLQTMGVNGPKVTGVLPIQSDLNRTTIVNSVVAISSIKTLLQEEALEGIYVKPRLVGMYLPFRGDQQMVQALVSAVHSRLPIEWKPCEG
ncbi:MAG: hypothetical protein RIF41_29975, partial [Polyangiaceae bacterium]